MPLPTGGTLSLQNHSRPGDAVPSKPKQAMIVRMSPETFDALQDFPSQPTMEFQFGPKPGIFIGNKFFPMAPSKEDAEHELYLRSASAAKPNAPLKLYATVTGKFRVERQLDGSIEDKVRDRTQVAEKQRTERKVLMLDTPPEITRVSGKKRKALPASSMMLKKAAHNDHIRNVSSAGSVLPSRVTSPLPPTLALSTPTPSTPTTPTFVMPPTPKESSVRRRMVQYLAVNPRSTEEVMRAIGGADCDASTRRQLSELLNEVAEQDPTAVKGDKSPRLWVLKPPTWLEVRPYEWKLSEPERTAMARAARMAFKSLKVPETHSAWENVRYRKTSLAIPTQSTASGNGSSRPNTPITVTAVPSSSSTAVTKPDAKRGVMSKDIKEKKAKAKLDAPKTKTVKSADVQMKDESAKMPSKLSSSRPKEALETSPAKSVSTQPVPSRRLPGSAAAARAGLLPPKPPATHDTSSGNSTPLLLRKPPTSADLPRPSQREREREREKESVGTSSSVPTKLKPSPAPAQSSVEKERKPSTTATMRIAKKVSSTPIEKTQSMDKDRDKERRPDKDRDREREREKERGRERETPPAPSVKRKKLMQEDEDHDSDASRRSSVQKKRRTETGALPVITSTPAPPALPAPSPKQSQPRIMDLSLPKKPATDLSRQKIPRAASPMVPRASMSSQSHNTSTSTLASTVATSSSSSSKPRAPPEKEKDRDREPDRPIPRTNGSTSTIIINGSSKPRRRSPIYTSSEDEGEITGQDRRELMPPGLPDFMYSNESPAPRPPLPPPWDHVNLRKRYNSAYQEYITIFSHMVSQKSQIQGMLRKDPEAERNTDMMLYPDELAKLAGEHSNLKDELENIKSMFLTKKTGEGDSPRSD